MKDSLRPHSFNVMISSLEYAALNELQRAYGWPKSHVVRLALHALYRHTIKSNPTCADCRACVAPHLVPKSPASPVQTIIPSYDAPTDTRG